jgi:hypothetical protein
MAAFLRKLFWSSSTHASDELNTALRKRKRATKDVKETAAKVQGAALDSVERSEATTRAIEDLLKRM